jgi:hypothetical protein
MTIEDRFKCTKCGADTSRYVVIEGEDNELCEKCGFEDAKKEAKEGKTKEVKEGDIEYRLEWWPESESEPVAYSIMALTERIEVTNELLLRLIKKVENVL